MKYLPNPGSMPLCRRCDDKLAFLTHTLHCSTHHGFSFDLYVSSALYPFQSYSLDLI